MFPTHHGQKLDVVILDELLHGLIEVFLNQPYKFMVDRFKQTVQMFLVGFLIR